MRGRGAGAACESTAATKSWWRVAPALCNGAGGGVGVSGGHEASIVVIQQGKV